MAEEVIRGSWPVPQDMTEEALKSYLRQLVGHEVTMQGQVVGNIISAVVDDGYVVVETNLAVNYTDPKIKLEVHPDG